VILASAVLSQYTRVTDRQTTDNIMGIVELAMQLQRSNTINICNTSTHSLTTVFLKLNRAANFLTARIIQGTKIINVKRDRIIFQPRRHGG